MKYFSNTVSGRLFPASGFFAHVYLIICRCMVRKWVFLLGFIDFFEHYFNLMVLQFHIFLRNQTFWLRNQKGWLRNWNLWLRNW
jgi:hypothetical protein